MNENSGNKPPLPSRWWIVAACLLAGIAIAQQAWSIRGHLGLLSASSRLTELHDQILDLETQRNQVQTDLAKSRPELGVLLKQVAIEDIKLADARKKREEAEKEANDKDAEAKVLEAECVALAKQKFELAADVARLDGEKKILETRHTELSNKVGSAEGQLKQLAGQITSATGELKGINDSISKQQESLSGLATQVGTKSADVMQLTAAQERLKEENAKLTADNDTLRTTHGDLVKQVADQQAKLDGINLEIANAQDVLLQLRSDAAPIRAAIKGLTFDLEKLQTKVDAAKKELDDLTKQVETQTALVAEKNKELQGLEVELKAKQAEYDAIAQRIIRARQDETSLLKHLEDLRAAATRTETMRPVEAPSPPPAPLSPSEPAAAKPANGKTPPSTPEPKELPKE